MHVYLGLFAIALLVTLGRADPAVAQECDPDVCANPNSFKGSNAQRRHKHIVWKKMRPAAPKVKQEYLRY